MKYLNLTGDTELIKKHLPRMVFIAKPGCIMRANGRFVTVPSWQFLAVSVFKRALKYCRDTDVIDSLSKVIQDFDCDTHHEVILTICAERKVNTYFSLSLLFTLLLSMEINKYPLTLEVHGR